MEKNLSKEFRETMEESKALFAKSVCDMSTLSNMDGDSIATNIKGMLLLNRLLDLCCDMFEKQDKLMDKMDKAMDKYLKE